MSPVDPNRAAERIKAIQKKYGEDAIHSGSEHQKIQRISTGSLELDYVTGGGIPIGRVSGFWRLFIRQILNVLECHKECPTTRTYLCLL